MPISLHIKHVCDHCGHTEEFKGNIQPDDLERMLWSFKMTSEKNCMAVDSRLPGRIFCSDECLVAALEEEGLKPYMGPVFA